MRSWCEPQPCCKLPPRSEQRSIGHRSCNGRCRDRTDTWDGRETAARLIASVPGQDLRFQSFDLAGERPQLRGNAVERRPGMIWQPLLLLVERLQRGSDAAGAHARYDPKLGKMA